MEQGTALFSYQMLPLLVLTIFFAIPLYRILKRTGKSRWWTILSIIPFPIFGGVVVLWIIAYGRWPKIAPPTS